MTLSYDNYLIELKNEQHLAAKTALRRLYELLKEEEPLLSKDDLYDRIMKDCLEIWQKGTIQKNMPDELKDLERQETGKKGRNKQLINVTVDGSVAHSPRANHFTNDNKNEDLLAEQHEIMEGFKQKIARNQEEIDRITPVIDKVKELQEQLAESRENEKRVKEQLKEQSEHYHGILKAINDNKNKTATETKEYQALLADYSIIREELDELKELERNRMKQHPEETFQVAATIPQTKEEPKEGSKPIGEIEVKFPARDLSTFFLDVKNCKHWMYLMIKDSVVIKWESDFKREKAIASRS